ncbi:LANO_0G07822g1_1 [Lachancea nothofagi CBS 11611]|uniref:LANO_0G07822g1_1 n=1 Tax=Lachancea nothofagi CBS 11611 TaxID=1266666 RepID=A0A1G4KI07_9SACH|nr:LANO_0G07822g1_1 [Lachancea nothofagi CBS 11611]
MLIVGLTGGIACGKSTVSKRLEESYKIPVIDADKIAREIVEPHRDAYNQIVRHFQAKIPDLLQSDGSLNRVALGKYVFANHADLKVLNGITHPAVRFEIFKQILCYYFQGKKMCVLDVPLLFESGLDKFCGVTVSVMCDQKLQIARICSRNSELSHQDAENRIKAQMTHKERSRRSDYILENNDTTELLYGQVQTLVGKIRPSWTRTILEYFPPFAIVSALAVVLIKHLRAQ